MQVCEVVLENACRGMQSVLQDATKLFLLCFSTTAAVCRVHAYLHSCAHWLSERAGRTADLANFTALHKRICNAPLPFQARRALRMVALLRDKLSTVLIAVC